MDGDAFCRGKDAACRCVMLLVVRRGDLELVAALEGKGEGFTQQTGRNHHVADHQLRFHRALVGHEAGVEGRAHVFGLGRQGQLVHGCAQHHAGTDDLDFGGGIAGVVARQGAQFTQDLVLVLGFDLQQGVGLVDRGGRQGVQGSQHQSGQQAQGNPGLVDQQDIEQPAQIDFIVIGLDRTGRSCCACVVVLHEVTSSSCFSTGRKRRKSVGERW